jgi:hypothetical protein
LSFGDLEPRREPSVHALQAIVNEVAHAQVGRFLAAAREALQPILKIGDRSRQSLIAQNRCALRFAHPIGFEHRSHASTLVSIPS